MQGKVKDLFKGQVLADVAFILWRRRSCRTIRRGAVWWRCGVPCFKWYLSQSGVVIEVESRKVLLHAIFVILPYQCSYCNLFSIKISNDRDVFEFLLRQGRLKCVCCSDDGMGFVWLWNSGKGTSSRRDRRRAFRRIGRLSWR